MLGGLMLAVSASSAALFGTNQRMALTERAAT